jgi:hypothetical protein
MGTKSRWVFGSFTLAIYVLLDSHIATLSCNHPEGAALVGLPKVSRLRHLINILAAVRIKAVDRLEEIFLRVLPYMAISFGLNSAAACAIS